MALAILGTVRGFVRDRLSLDLKKLIPVMALGALLAFGLTRVLPASYRSDVTLLLDSDEGIGNLGGLSQMVDLFQPGMLGAGGDAVRGYSYVGILESRALLERVLQYPDPSTGGRTRIFDVYAPRSGAMARRSEVAVKGLRESIHTNFSTRNYFLQLSVRSRNASTAKAIADLLIFELGKFNSSSRVSRARAALAFVTLRVQESADSLARCERDLAAFRQSNIRIGSAPGLQLTEARLQRRVRLCEESYLLLSKQLEIARIEEKRNSPVFSIVDPPVEAARPERISGVLTLVLGATFSGILYALTVSVRRIWGSEMASKIDNRKD